MLCVAQEAPDPALCATLIQKQAFNFTLEASHQFSSGKGLFYGENVSLIRNFVKGTTAKAHAMAMGAHG